MSSAVQHRRPTQKERVLHLLEQAGSRGVRTNEFLTDRLPRFSARILELRNEGWVIENRPDAYSANGVIYTLVGRLAPSQPRPRKPSKREVDDRILALSERFDVVTVTTRREPSADVTRWTIEFQNHVSIGMTLAEALDSAERWL